MDIKSWWQKKRKDHQSLSSDGASPSSEFSPGAIALGKTLDQIDWKNGYNVPMPELPDPISFFPEIRKDNNPIQLVRFNDAFLAIFTCQSCRFQQYKEFGSIFSSKKEVTDAVFAWLHSITDEFPKCSSVCEVMEAIAK